MQRVNRRYFLKNVSIAFPAIPLIRGLGLPIILSDLPDFGQKNLTVAASIDTPSADDYEKYVSQAIVLSKQIAQSDAYLRELGVFNPLTGEAQSHISTMSSSAASICELSVSLKNISDLKDQAGNINLDETLRQFYISTQLIAMYKAFSDNLAAFNTLLAGFNQRTKPNLDQYSLDNINFGFPSLDIEWPDGVVIPMLGYDEASIIAMLVIDLLQVITNLLEKHKIEEQARRLHDNQVNLDEYKQDAVQAVTDIHAEFQAFFDLYSQLAASYEQWFDTVPLADLQNHYQLVNQYLDTFSKEEVNRVDQFARAAVRKLLQKQNETDDLYKANITANLRINDNLAALQNANGAGKDNLIEQLNADIALANVMDLMYTKQLIPAIQKAIQNPATSTIHVLHSPEYLVAYYHPVRHEAAFERIDAVYRQRAADIGHNGNWFPPGNRLELSVFLAQNGATGPNGQNGTYTNSTGGFTQYEKDPTVSDYEMEGSAPLTYVTDQENTWDTAGAIVAKTFDIPGAFSLNSERAQAVDATLARHLGMLNQRKAQFDMITGDFKKSRKDYLNNTLKPSVKQATDSIPSLSKTVNDTLLPLLKTDQKVEIPVPKPIEFPNTSIASIPLQNWMTQTTAAEQNPAQLLPLIEPVWMVAQLRMTDLTTPDKRSLQELYEHYFDKNGLIKDQFIPGVSPGVASSARTSLKSDPGTTVGRNIRYQLNRGLVAAASTNPDIAQAAYGGIATTLAADMASSDGKGDVSATLLHSASHQFDLIAGFIPGVNVVNDTVQILYGMATGYDYTGRKMEAGDYALRAVGIVLGLLPAAVIKIGINAVGSAFLDGCQLLRDFNLGGKVQATFTIAKGLLLDFTESLGEWFPRQLAKIVPPEDLGQKIIQLTDGAAPLAGKMVGLANGGVFEDHVLGVLGYPKNAVPILRGTAQDAMYRIPDILDNENLILGEIKSNKNLDLTPQLSDFLRYAASQTPPLEFRLYVMEDTTLTTKLMDALQNIGSKVISVGPHGELTVLGK